MILARDLLYNGHLHSRYLDMLKLLIVAVVLAATSPLTRADSLLSSSNNFSEMYSENLIRSDLQNILKTQIRSIRLNTESHMEQLLKDNEKELSHKTEKALRQEYDQKPAESSDQIETVRDNNIRPRTLQMATTSRTREDTHAIEAQLFAHAHVQRPVSDH